MHTNTNPSPDTPCPFVHTLTEAAFLVRGSRSTIQRAADAGQLKIMGRGRNRYVESRSLRSWVDRGMPLTPVDAEGHC